MKQLEIIIPPIESIETYAAVLIYSAHTLKRLSAIQEEAMRKGILDKDEMEAATKIHYQIEGLIVAYKTQQKNVLDRTKIAVEEILKLAEEMIPNLKIPEKRNIEE